MSRHRAPEVRHPVRSAAVRGLFWLARAAVLAARGGGARAGDGGRGRRVRLRVVTRRRAAADLHRCPVVPAHGRGLAGRCRRLAGERPRLPVRRRAGTWWFRAAAAPYRAWDAMWWLTPEAPADFDARQWRHQVRAARALITAPESLPLLSRHGHVVAGAAIRSVRHRAGLAATIPYERLRAHQVAIGPTGTGNPVPELKNCY